jgi:hypothetical protein
VDPNAKLEEARGLAASIAEKRLFDQWETDEIVIAGVKLSSAFRCLDAFLSAGGILPREWVKFLPAGTISPEEYAAAEPEDAVDGPNECSFFDDVSEAELCDPGEG